MLAEARSHFEALDEPDEVAHTDLALVEVLQDAGRSREAREALGRLGPDHRSATYLRLVGRDHAGAGRTDAARAAFADGLEVAALAEDRLEQALLLEELAGVAGPVEHGADAAVRRAQDALESLGVLHVR
jgi:hypothetical protein